jgi:colicin import membrane protein
MHAGADRLEFAPPETPGQLRALILAVLAHALLVLALTWGVHWKRDAEVLSADAELWSAVPQEAAPKLVEPPPEPEQPPPEPPQPVVPPRPTPPVQQPEPVVKAPEVDIALEKEKLRLKKVHQLELAKQEELKQEKLKQEKIKQEKAKQEKARQEQAKLEQAKLEQAKLEKAKLEKQKQDKDKQKQEQLKQDKLKQAQAEKAAQDKKQSEQEAKQLADIRTKNLQRIAGLAGASGSDNAKGSALKSSGPSASYGGRVRARVKPNIVFTEEISGNPTAEVEVHTSPDGTIISRKIAKSSGVKSWDEAVLKALDKTAVLPRDTDGTVPSSLLLVFQPKD